MEVTLRTIIERIYNEDYDVIDIMDVKDLLLNYGDLPLLVEGEHGECFVKNQTLSEKEIILHI